MANRSFLARLLRFVKARLNYLHPEILLLKVKSCLNVKRRLDYEKADIFLNVNSEIEFLTRLHSCKKEPELVSWIEQFFQPGDVFFDIGANVGAYSLVAAKYHDGKVQVFSFEPSYLNFYQLCNNISINQCQDLIVPLQIALGEKTCIETFNYSNLTFGGALHSLGSPVDYKGDSFQPVFKQPVMVCRMDDLVNYYKIPVPNHIKIDVDGTEPQILKGACKLLDDRRLRSVLIEVEEGINSDQIQSSLKDFGFRVHAKTKYTPPNDTGPFSKGYNYIFTRDQ